MKTKEELNTMKKEIETMNKKFAELTERELAQVSGGHKPVDDKPLFSDSPSPYLSAQERKEPECLNEERKGNNYIITI